MHRQERTLVRRMLAGEERAFERFADEYLPQLYRFAQRRLGGDGELTREIVQITTCKAIAKLGTFRGESMLMTWLCAVCRNEIAGHFRRVGRMGYEVEISEAALEPVEAANPGRLSGPEGELLRREKADLVHAALDALPPHYGRALEWKYLENLSVKEIAARMDVGAKAAESLLTRARQAFKEGYGALHAQAGTKAPRVPPLQAGTVVES